MNINEVLLNIPQVLSSSFEIIYVASKEENKFYSVTYNGSKIKTQEPLEYSAFEKIINNIDKNILKEIETKESFNKVFNDKVIVASKVKTYEMIFIMPLTQEVITMDDAIEFEAEDEKPLLLIADDSNIITNFFSKIFSDKYEVLVAQNGEVAKSLILNNKDRDLRGVFIDLNMPVMSGYELLDYLRDNNLLDEIPVSVISGEDSEEGINRVTEYKIVDMLQKPFTRRAAETIVEKTVNFKHKKK